MPLNLERPTIEGSFAFPQQFFITMYVLPIDIVFRRVIAQKTQVEKIRRARQKFEGRKISFVDRGRIGPHPANAMFFQKSNDLRSMPASIAEFNRKSEIPRKLLKKLTQRCLAVFWRKGRRQLDENHVKLWRERLHRLEKQVQFRCAIAQPASVRDLPGKFAGEPKSSRCNLDPTTNGRFGGSTVKGRIDFHGGKVIGVKLEPLRLRQIRRIKRAMPVFKSPCARADAYFMLIGQIQWGVISSAGETSRAG